MIHLLTLNNFIQFFIIIRCEILLELKDYVNMMEKLGALVVSYEKYALKKIVFLYQFK
jgi:hypothetical protein